MIDLGHGAIRFYAGPIGCTKVNDPSPYLPPTSAKVLKPTMVREPSARTICRLSRRLSVPSVKSTGFVAAASPAYHSYPSVLKLCTQCCNEGCRYYTWVAAFQKKANDTLKTRTLQLLNQIVQAILLGQTTKRWDLTTVATVESVRISFEIPLSWLCQVVECCKMYVADHLVRI